ncbi:adventurous gliding motility protein CglE [Anaeromyxobacter paludicola]|uniref:Adventurous gliding motility protein CglE n=1 Tax=Anaeromyxobacter paludicola TaxID=2918171 RepID=A0ABM7XA05_9BACT|nr:adventurous gliding motility protein CglE [Anaeromyxobacter paludicola]BDG08682.1 hypothetical protein AMPC_17950 [Anaeromyxobacter paludicola]
MTPTRAALGLAVLLAAAAARAAEPAPPLEEDPRAPRFHEVEHGAFTTLETGWFTLFKTRVADRARYPYAGAGGGAASGWLAGARLGTELGDRFALAGVVLVGNASASPSYGAFDLLMIGGDLRAAVWRGADRQGVDRLLLYLHGRAGWLATRPDGLFGSSDLLLGGGPGLEYYTHLRHFSIGLALDGIYAVSAGAPGLAVTPTVTYTF